MESVNTSSGSHTRNRWPRRLAVVASIAALWAAFVALGVELGLDLFSFWPLISLGLLVAALVVAVIGLIRAAMVRNARVLLAGITMIVFWYSGMWASAIISRWQERETMRVAEELLAALRQYRADHGVYPARLDELIPDYIERIPRTHMGWFGQPFVFGTHARDADEFALSFPCQLKFLQSYESKSRVWRRHD